MKKRLGLVAVLSVVLLTGCVESEYNYNGKVFSESDLEEIISDTLELENPEMDIEVDVYEEVED